MTKAEEVVSVSKCTEVALVGGAVIGTLLEIGFLFVLNPPDPDCLMF